MRIRKQKATVAVNPGPAATMEEEGPPLEPQASTKTTTTPLLSDDIRLEGTPLSSGSPLLEAPSSNAAEEDAHHLEVSNDGGNDDGTFSGNVPSSSSSSFRRLLYLLTSPLTDDQGRQPLAIFMGLLSMALGGLLLGILLPKSQSLPIRPAFIVSWTPAFVSYRTISSCIGYTYFLSWSTSFYPQLLTNFRRKTTAGLSADFCVLNVLGFSWYVCRLF
jgi:PQ loop repeat